MDNEQSYIEQLKAKVQNQAQRLCELQEAKMNLEKQIKDYQNTLSITNKKSQLSTNVTLNKKNLDCNSIICDNMKKTIKEDLDKANTAYYELEKRHNDLKTKYSSLQSLYNNLKTTMIVPHKSGTNQYKYNQYDNNNSNTNSKVISDFKQAFPSPDRLNYDNLREAYNQLYSYTNDLSSEKEAISSQLKEEIILNEECKSFIEILKQVIESSIIKEGLNFIIQQNKQKHYNKDASNLEVIIDIAMLQNEIDMLKKSQKQDYEKTEEIKQVNDELINNNNDLNNKVNELHEEIREMSNEIEVKNKENEEINNKIEELNNKNTEILEELGFINKEYEVLQEKYDLLSKSNKETINKLEETESKNKELQIAKEKLCLDFNDVVKKSSILHEDNCKKDEMIRSNSQKSLVKENILKEEQNVLMRNKVNRGRDLGEFMDSNSNSVSNILNNNNIREIKELKDRSISNNSRYSNNNNSINELTSRLNSPHDIVNNTNNNLKANTNTNRKDLNNSYLKQKDTLSGEQQHEQKQVINNIIDKFEREIHNLNNIINSKKQENVEVKYAKDQAELLYQTTDKELKQSTFNYNRLKQDFDNLEIEYKNALDENKTLLEEISNTRNNYYSRVQDENNQIDQLIKEIQLHKSEAIDYKNKFYSNENSKQQYINRNMELNQENDILNRKCNELMNLNFTLQNICESQKVELAQISKEQQKDPSRLLLHINNTIIFFS